MKKPKHTPGPWEAKIDPELEQFFIRASNGDKVAHAAIFKGRPIERRSDLEIESNARLIAAAPELLEALKAVQVAQRKGTYADAFALVDAAVKKAEGN